MALFRSPSSPWSRALMRFQRGRLAARAIAGAPMDAPPLVAAYAAPSLDTGAATGERVAASGNIEGAGATRGPDRLGTGSAGAARDAPTEAPAGASPREAVRPRPTTAEDIAHSPLAFLNLTSVELVVLPFSSFRAVVLFQQLLTATPGVHAARLRRLQQGVLQMRVECGDSFELIEALRETCRPSFRFRVQSHEAHRIEVVLEEADEEVAHVL